MEEKGVGENFFSEIKHEFLFLKQEISQLRQELHSLRNDKIKAVFLLAGSGSRLRPLTNDLPKCLVKVNGTSMLHRALDNVVKTNKIHEVILVVGYAKEKIKQAIGEDYKGLKITYVDNNDYNETNNIYSLWLARYHLDTDFILLEGDMVFDYRVLEKLLSERKNKLAVARHYPKLMDGLLVSVDEKDNQIDFFISKQIQRENKFNCPNKYKTINIYYFTKEFFEKYFCPMLNFYINNIGRNSFYESMLGALTYIKIPLYAEIIEDNIPWYEIDTPEDLEIANRIFSTENFSFRNFSKNFFNQ